MGVFQNAFFFAGCMYAIFCEQQLAIYFLAFVGLYTICYILTPSGNVNPLRRRLMFATWERPSEGNINIKVELDCTKVNAYINSFEKGNRPSVTHVAVKALAVCLHKAKDSLNGKIVFNKFVPFDDVSVSVLVDIDGGKDLAAMTIPKCNEMKIKELQEYIKDKGTKTKKGKDSDHQARNNSIKWMPPFIIKVSLQIMQWISFNLGLSLKPMAIKRNAFGAGCVTSLGMLGVKDAYVPFSPFMNCPVILAVGECTDKAVVKDGKIVIAPMVNLNYTVDHRFIDGAKGKALLSDVHDIFENPEKY